MPAIIKNDAGALARMDQLIDDYDAIEQWEDQSAEFAEFNAAAAIYKEEAPALAPKSAEMRRAERL